MSILGKNTHNAHIAIIGSGIIGKFNSLKLSELGYKITIIDPFKRRNSSSAALGILMGAIYQKRSGRSWLLREKSMKLWPKWIEILNKYNSQLKIDKPLFQLTTDNNKFEKMKRFIVKHPCENFKILDKKSDLIRNISNVFEETNLQGIISFDDGRINPKELLKTLDIYLKSKKINHINDEIIKIEQNKNLWVARCKNGGQIVANAIVLCNSLESLNLIDADKFGIKLKPILGQAIEISHEDKKINFLSLPKVFSINGRNFIPINERKIIVGSTDEKSTNPNDYKVNELIDFLDKKPSWLNKRNISNKWFGVRSRPEEEASPILKSLNKGLILCSGFYKNGILLAPACAEWISNEIKSHL